MNPPGHVKHSEEPLSGEGCTAAERNGGHHSRASPEKALGTTDSPEHQKHLWAHLRIPSEEKLQAKFIQQLQTLMEAPTHPRTTEDFLHADFFFTLVLLSHCPAGFIL
jgi:hypothetical protein